MNRKEQAQQLANERSKHKLRLKKKGTLGGLNPTRDEVDKAVLQAVVDRIRACLPSVKDIGQAHRNRQRESAIRERIQRTQQQPAYRKLPYRWNGASFIECGASSFTGGQQRAGSNADIHNKDLSALNAELLSFAKYSCLTTRESDLRETVVKEITDAILCKWPQAKVKVFGSFPSGLSIFSSDLDISLQNMGVDVDFDGNEVLVSPSSSTLPRPESVVDLTVNEVIDLTGDAEEPVTWTFDVGKGLAGGPESGAKRKRGTEDCEEADEQESKSDGAAAEDEGNSDSEGESQSESGESDAYLSGGDDCEGDEGEDGDGDESNWEQWKSGGRADEDLELNLSSSAASSSSSSSRGRPSISESVRKLRVQAMLKLVAAHLRGMGWCMDLDVRLKARVPIIALKHRCGLSVDISLGVAAEDHTTTVRQMIQSSSFREFFPICSFLKIFLAQLDLDKPYIGGVGSFKLYAMIAAVIQKRRASGQSTPQPHSLAGILRLFFSHWGSPANLNERTKVVLPLPRLDDCDANAQNGKLEVAFDRVFKVGALQQAFKIADRVMSESLKHQRPADCSILGRLIDAKSFCDDRVKHSDIAKNYPLYSLNDKLTVARQLLQELHKKHHSAVPKSCSLEQLKTVCPALVTRLLSYKDSHEALYPGGGQGARRHPAGFSTMPPGATRNKKKKQKQTSSTGGRNVIFGKGSQGVVGREMVLSSSRGEKRVFRS